MIKTWGLRGRSITYCVGLLLGTVGTLGTVLVWQSYRQSIRTNKDHAATYARSLSYSAEPAVMLNDQKALQNVVQAASQDAFVQSARIQDSQGKLLAEYHRASNKHSETASGEMENALHRHPDHQVRMEQSANSLRISVPIWPGANDIDLELIEDEKGSPAKDKSIGTLSLVYSLEPVYAQMRLSFLSVAAVSAFVLLVGIVITVVMVEALLKPVRNLVRTSTALANGDLQERVNERATGEIGVLAGAFNHMADRLQGSYASIERQVEERTTELVQANNAKSDFLANMSHEIRTPMTAIIGFSENLLDPNITESDKLNATNTIRRNSMHLLKIINDILDISKIEAGKLELDPMECSPCQIVADAASLMRVPAAAKNLGFKVEFLGPIPEKVRTDPTRFRQVLINLIDNAVKFTKAGDIRVVMGFDPGKKQNPTSGHHLNFQVIDSGIGMSPEQVNKIFNPFTQADETMTRRFGGTGLGLTISKRLIELLGGEIKVESEPDRGTSFLFSIGVEPVDDAEMLPAPTEADFGFSPERNKTKAELPKLNCRILLAEDGQDNQRLITYVLKKAGAEVVVAENGQEAVDIIMNAIRNNTGPDDRRPPFDVVLMDMQMPVLDGYTATKLLREKGYAHPILALTAHAMERDRQRCIDAGCDEYATKPIDRLSLIQLILRFVNRDDHPVSATAAERFVNSLPAQIRAIQETIAAGNIELLKALADDLQAGAIEAGCLAIHQAAQALEEVLDVSLLQGKLDELTALCQQAAEQSSVS
jgi:signal transduction histidine kinase/DNA-binding response OmpR family regulator